MDLLDRYLGAIGRHLPEAQKADVTAELRDVLLSQIEDEEARLGRAQTGVELEAMLIRFGHPLTVSGRYRKIQHLIGPEVFPFWWAGLKMSLMIVAGLYVVLAILTVVGGEDAALVGDRTAPSLTAALIFALGAVTLVCALIERFGKTVLLNRWKPAELPPAKGSRHSPFERTVDIGIDLVFIFWWIGLIRLGNVSANDALRIELAPVWADWFWPILIFSLYELGANLLALLKPGRAGLVETLLAIRSLVGAAMLGGIYHANHWLVVTSETLPPGVAAQVQSNFDRGIRIGIAAAIVVYVILAGVSFRRLWQDRRAVEGSMARVT